MGPEVPARVRRYRGRGAADRAVGRRGLEGGGAGHEVGGRAGDKARGAAEAGNQSAENGEPALGKLVSRAVWEIGGFDAL